MCQSRTISQSNDFKSQQCDQIFQIASQEICLITQNIHLSIFLKVESANKLPTIDGSGYFFKVVCPETGLNRYWINWTEDLGAWIEAEGTKATILVKESSEIEQVESSLITCFASHVAATCLSLQGRITIHANVIAVDRFAVAFAGDSGKGKSTLTAYCASRGAGFVTDDVLLVDAEGLAHPGSPRIKLFPSTGHYLGLNIAQETAYKIHYQPEYLGAFVQTTPLPLGIIYLLEDSAAEIYSELLAPGQAIMELIKNSYHTSVIMRDRLHFFDDYINLMNKTAVKKLFYPRKIERLPEVYNFILQEILQLSNSHR